MSELTFSGSRDATTIKLEEEIQRAINDGKSRFRLRVYFSGKFTDNDGEYDFITLFLDHTTLNIEYF